MADNYLWGEPYTYNEIYHAVLNSDFTSTELEDDVSVYDDPMDHSMALIKPGVQMDHYFWFLFGFIAI